MATLLFTALGTLLGGPLGGALGAFAGRQIDGLIFGGGTREGPRLKDLNVTTSSYGIVVPHHYGRMRVSGLVIWSTDLVEHRNEEGGGKGQPSVTTYSYSASFAVALASRPVTGLGRIWADGNLLRGEAGDLKVGGTLRIHPGRGDQAADPLIAAAEGAQACPAFRGLAYAVFEDLQLEEFGNRIPALTFEVFADEGPLTLDLLFDGWPGTVDAAVPLTGLTGLSCEGPLAGVLEQLDPLFPMDCDAAAGPLTLAPERLQQAPIALPEASVSMKDGDFGGSAGFTRRRAAPVESRLRLLRYYDVDRDFQPGLQRAPGREPGGEPGAIELPAAMGAEATQTLIAAAARRSIQGRETLSWRTGELDLRVVPGATVTVSGQPGLWRVTEWEWRDSGVELALHRLPSQGLAGLVAPGGDSGRANLPPDRLLAPTALTAFELPWDGLGSGDAPAIFAAVSSSGAGWKGAALYADAGDGQLVALGPSGRRRATMGQALSALAPASPHLIDRSSVLEVRLLASDLILTDASPSQLAAGANRALIGEEVVQFGRATPLGDGRWRLAGILRGRGGTEHAIATHAAEEPFVLLDGAAVRLDPALVPASSGARIAALGLADTVPVISAIAARGTTLRPPSPVHPRAHSLGGELRLGWTRRARGAWLWRDGVDAPLIEQGESYEVTYGPIEAPIARWDTGAPDLLIEAATLGALAAALPGGSFHVRQRGTHALSLPLLLATLA